MSALVRSTAIGPQRVLTRPLSPPAEHHAVPLPSTDSLAIDCRNLIKTYPGRPPVEAVRGVNLQVRRGECFGVLGPNGAGKTTTIEILEGLMPPTAGDVMVLGMTWRDDEAALRQRIGISLQETRMSEKLTVLETLTLFRSFYRQGVTPREAMNRVSLQEKANARIQHLSGGQRQRLAVAVALVGQPELLFLDEPTTGLDPQSRRQLWEVIAGLRAAGGTILLTTHYMEEAEQLCERVAIVDQGRVIALGSPRELINGLGAAHVIEFSLLEDSEPELEVWSAIRSAAAAEFRDGVFRLTVAEPHIAIPDLLHLAQQRRQTLASLTTRHASLDDVFVKLTGRNLDEEMEQST